MAWYHEDNLSTLNFVIVGNCKSGCDILQASLSAHPDIVCHGDVLHKDEAIRKAEHEDYFGESGKVPDWYLPGHLSVEQYLNNKIFDNTLHDECAVGVKIGYDLFIENDLWDYIDQKGRHGDFCLIHITRNPVDCFVAKQQDAVEFNNWGIPRYPGAGSNVRLDSDELTSFVRSHLATELKIDRLCDDRAVIDYQELLLDFRGVLQKLFEFLELKFSPACVPNLKRITDSGIQDQVGNWASLTSGLPRDVLEFVERPVLL